MNMSVHRRRRREGFLLCLLLAVFILQPSSCAWASDYNIDTDYRNWWFAPSPGNGPYSNYFGVGQAGVTNASTAVYGGHALGNTSAVAPSNRVFRLVQSAFGQPVEGLQADVNLGDVIPPPTGADTNQPPWNFTAVRVGNNPAAYYECQDPPGGAFWAPSTKQVIAAQPNNVEIHWRTTGGTTNVQVLLVGAVPSSRPARLFWTESPYDAPTVNLNGFFPVVHYNSEVTRPVYEAVTNVQGGVTNVSSNVVSGVWLDDQKRLRAMEVSGMFILEYYEAGTYSQQVQPVGIEIVQVLEPDVQLLSADIGERLLPADSYWSQMEGINDLDAYVSQGLAETAYRFDHVGPKQGWVYAIKRTVDKPWSLEVYWRHPGVMGVLWPFEYDWYACDWPAHPQVRVVSAATQTTAAVLVPAELTGQLMDYMDPPLHATLSVSGKSLMMTAPGHCLMKYTTHDDIWFEVIKSVSRTNTVHFDLTERDWDIGEELRPPALEAHALAFDGGDDHVAFSTSWLNKQTNWTLALWFQAAEARAGALYTEAVEGPTLEINVGSGGEIYVGIWNEYIAGRWAHCRTPDGLVATGTWQHLAVTLENGDDASNGTLRVYLDTAEVASTNMSRLHFEGAGRGVIAAGTHYPGGAATNFFHGRMDEVRIWNRTLSPTEIESNRYELAAASEYGLLANYSFYEGAGDVVHNEAGGYAGSLIGGPVWCFGQIDPTVDFAAFPGYIYEPYGDRYNVDLYNYPTESNPDAASYVFAVNTNTLEVWWANRSRQEGMPPVYYPSWVGRYRCGWPTGMPQIVIASGLGSQGDQLTAADNALAFDGAGDVSVVGHDDVFDLEQAVTLEAWIRPDVVTGQMAIVTKGEELPLPNGFMLGMSNGTFRAWFADLFNNRYELAWGSPATGQWAHVAVTIQRDGLMAGYLNGVLAVQTAGPTAALNPAAAALAIGANSDLDGAFFDGRIGEVRIWSTARTPAQIRSHWLARLAGNEAGLVACYPFVRGTNEAVLADAGPHGMDGLVTDAQWVAPGRPVPVSDAMRLADDSIYVQNDASLPGYNPNEEHALVMGGVAYALRDDLNTPASSEPFVLVDYLDADTARPKMALFGVVRTNLQYPFVYDLEAGLPIQPPLPLGAMPPCTNTFSHTQPPAWRDRKLGWWARSAGDDGGYTNAVMHFYYTMQPDFWFPKLSAADQPAVGTELPWLPTPPSTNGLSGTPVDVTYEIRWPENVPTMKIGQTLTHAAQGLPAVWDQLSVESVYQQSAQRGQGNCVVLFDPVRDQTANLSNVVVEAMTQAGLARHDLTDARTRFTSLPPSLYPRLFYDPDRGEYGQLVLEGVYEETLTGGGYLLLNLLADFEKAQAISAAEGIDAGLKNQWNDAINALRQTITKIKPNEPFVHAAAYAGLGKGTGYVTLAFNNSTNPIQVPPALPVSLSIFKVAPELAAGTIEVLEPEDVLDEQLTLRTSLDYGGDLDQYEFEWRWIEPEGGLAPNTNFTSWAAYGPEPSPGSNVVTIAGASEFTLVDHYFAVRYRKMDDTGPTGTNWSQWAYNLAPGWVQRVMNGINPFEQTLQDTLEHAVDTRSTMISLAGEPYQGDIALNLEAASDGGLIPVYQTVLNRAMDFSIRAGPTTDEGCQTLLFAASRLHDLYMLLGNEAYSDAQDPTLAFPRALYEDEHGAEATGLFSFMNQVPNLLEEELALLRGRDDTLEPQVTIGPVYNRLIWNFTKGINGGEAAYAYSYNIRGTPTNTVGAITAEDAKRLYPQGHGDAWGHYLSALMGYYQLLANPNFTWHTEPGATLLGNATVSTDFFDEQKFAEAAAARARTGVEIVNRTYRKAYAEAPTTRWAGYRDSNTNRAWGLAGWASRTGQGAYYDWATANSL
ncbi:MAG: LamG domain-containing protein, partial [Candidatus Marinimicrobia bacterium]|nr:LamG domain-containing protein [Candidatus Neomarinimicrobiota bacterium]